MMLVFMEYSFIMMSLGVFWGRYVLILFYRWKSGGLRGYVIWDYIIVKR